MKKLSQLLLATSLLAVCAFTATAKPIKAGLAKVAITPDRPVWLSGYASRTKPSEGKLHDIWAKALAVEDERGNRFVLVSAEILGFSHEVAEAIAARAQQHYGLRREQLMLNATHTHSAPVIRQNLIGAYDLDAEQTARVNEYAQQLQDKVVAVIGEALRDLAPAKLSFTHGTGSFAKNRRQPAPTGMRIGINDSGPVDHDVPVLVVESADGKLRGLVFGYACHTTTLTDKHYEVSGDYAGFAQAALERDHPGATAMFVMGAGADINPNPRSKIEYAQAYGQALAAAVDQLVSGTMPLLRGELKLAFDRVSLPFGPMPTRAEWEARTKDENLFRRKHAERWLAKLERDGRLMRDYPYSLQAVQFGNDLRMVVMAGEVVVDYALRLKRELGREGLWVVAYANDACSYIPSARILKEGGYEASDSMIYYDLPTSYAPEVEERIVGKVHEMLKRLRQERPKKSVW